ncbi:CD82 antigen [Ctenopharyngodon idella]|uniref:CD82 antigen n=1 Tax=Ctenopharyngodon idella TaxID=7959 RepID=UPI002232642E|nr:CD82 antigen [Ctenopharyngodon idella]
MKADDKLQILKFFLMLVNSFFVILGISIFACSAWILFDKDSFVSVLSSGQDVKVVAGGLFFIGLVVVGVSLLGGAGVYFESRCFIIFYLCFLIVIILGQIFITFVLFIQRQKIEQFLRDNVDEIIRQYGGNETQTFWTLLDSVQTSAKCCGRLSSDEWRNNTVIASLGGTDIYPCSCFNDTCPVIPHSFGTHSFGQGSDFIKTGCETVLLDWLETNIFVILGMEVGLLLIQILQFIFGVQIYKCIGRKTRELHPNLLIPVEENPAANTEHQQYSTENHQFEIQTYNNPQMDSGNYHHNRYADENYDQYNNPEFYKQDNSQMYNSPHVLQYQQSYNGSYDQGFIHHQNYHQRYNHDDY